MGNVNDRVTCDTNREYAFVGRTKELQKIFKDLDGRRRLVIQINGMQEIGKSRVLIQVLKNYYERRKCIFSDFSLESETLDSNFFMKLLQELQEELNENHVDKDIESKPRTPQLAINALMKRIELLNRDVLLFLDNIDKAFTSATFKDNVLEFLKAVCNSPNSKLRVIFTTTEKLRITSKAFSDHYIGPLKVLDIDKLFRCVINDKGDSGDIDDYVGLEDEKESDEDEEDEDDIEYLIAQILSESNKKYVTALVNLCSGLPKIATMIGSELTANNGLITPRDMLVLIIEDCLDTLSPDCYPKTDRADYYQEAIQKVKDRRRLLDELNKDMDKTNTVELDRVVKHVEDAKYEADAKQKVKPLLENNIAQYSTKDQNFKFPSIIRDCLLASKQLEEIEEDQKLKDLLKQGRLAVTKLPGVPESVATSPRELEQCLKDLEIVDSHTQQKGHLISQPSEEDETGMYAYFELHNNREMSENEQRTRRCDRCNSPVELNNRGAGSLSNYVDDNNIHRCRCAEKSDKSESKFVNESITSFSGPSAMPYIRSLSGNHGRELQIHTIATVNDLDGDNPSSNEISGNNIPDKAETTDPARSIEDNTSIPECAITYSNNSNMNNLDTRPVEITERSDIGTAEDNFGEEIDYDLAHESMLGNIPSPDREDVEIKNTELSTAFKPADQSEHVQSHNKPDTGLVTSEDVKTVTGPDNKVGAIGAVYATMGDIDNKNKHASGEVAGVDHGGGDGKHSDDVSGVERGIHDKTGQIRGRLETSLHDSD